VAGPADLEIIRADNGWVVIGELDARSAPSLATALAAEPDRPRTCHLDLAGVTFIDSSGLGVLVALARDAADGGGSIRLDQPSHSVMRLLQITRMTEMFGVE
jgi:anti-anti-sigma factor